MFKQIYTNWNLSPISHILTTNNNTCPLGYDKVINYMIPGIRDGCNCLGIFNIPNYPEYEDKILVSSCSQLLHQMGCKDIVGFSKKTINSIGSSTYCAERNNNFNYIDNFTSIYTECPGNTSNCGSIDSIGGLLCLDSCDDNSYSIEYLISQGPVCINNNEINLLVLHRYDLFENRKSLKCNTTIKDFKYDDRYKTQETYLTRDLFNAKQIQEFENLPNFDLDFFNYLITLYGRNYIGWYKKCEQFMLEFIAIRDIISLVETNSVYYMVISLFILIYCMLFIIILKEIIYQQYILKIGIISIFTSLKLLITVNLLSDYFLIRKKKNLLEHLIMKECSDDETNILLPYLLESCVYVMWIYLIDIVLYLIMIFISMFKILIFVYKLHKHKLLALMINGRTDTFELIFLL
jgi:hypothetical protein